MIFIFRKKTLRIVAILCSCFFVILIVLMYLTVALVHKENRGRNLLNLRALLLSTQVYISMDQFYLQAFNVFIYFASATSDISRLPFVVHNFFQF